MIEWHILKVKRCVIRRILYTVRLLNFNSTHSEMFTANSVLWEDEEKKTKLQLLMKLIAC